ncbi:PAS domain-containing protein [Hymenobacter latericus]|uniref:PAS domain-containing protein n=1 Tax=Hymenobacter sp. YIM 151858-1 TaxID=2987688 RepID=UPI002225CC2E|nr:PAS domain-containing protein [Hymenobacter sp. YIM 151858-1]UYZ61136.1 PAS domain-containing protein [Hymenobacter sp. YIM 151858-1]
MTYSPASAPPPAPGTEFWLRHVAAHLPYGVLLVDPAGTVQLLNDAFCRLWYLAEEPSRWTGRPAEALQDALLARVADPAAFRRRSEALRAAGQPNLRHPVLLTDGRWLELDFLPLQAPAAGVLVHVRDVTEREQLLAELRSVSRIPEQNPNPILRLARTGATLYRNPAYQWWADSLMPVARAAAEQQARSWAPLALAAGQPQQHRLAVAGRVFDAHVVPFPADDYVNFYFVDVTEEHRAEQRLQAQQAFYQNILDTLPVEVVVLDAEQRYCYANPAAVPDEEQRRWLPGHTLAEYAARYALPLQELAEQRARHFAEALRTEAALPTWAESSALPAEAPRHFLRSYRRLPGPPGAPAQVLGYGLEVSERYRAEQQLAEQRVFYESILNELPSQIAVFDPAGRYRFLNAAALPDAAARAALLGQPVVAYVARQGWPAAVAETRQARFLAAVATQQPQQWQEATAAADGQPQHFLRHYQPVADAAGRLRYVIGYGTDFTARVRAEEAVQASEARLREQQQFMQGLLNTTQSVVYVRDAQGAFHFVNEAMRVLQAELGTLEELPADRQPLRAEELARYAALDAEVLATGRTLHAEDRLTMVDGAVRWYYTVKSPLPRPQGDTHVLGVSTDITALKEAQLTLARSEKQYRDLMHYAQALICTYDLQGRVLSVNPALARLLGYEPEELLGQPVRQYLLAEEQPHFGQYLDYIAAQGEAQGVLRVRPRDPDAPVHHLLYHNFVVREPGQEPYIISHSQDITARVRAEQATQLARDEAEAAARARANFLANMSHEIRTPLNGVLGMAALLAKTRLDPAQREQLDIIQASGQHLLGVVNDVLDMAKISSGKVELAYAPFNLCDAVQQAVAPLAVRAREQGLEFRVEPIDIACPWVLGDAFRLNQVLLNLLGNALKFTPAGFVALRGRLLGHDDSALMVEFQVQDSGVGIAPEQQARIFESFTQAYADTARRYGGTGLGLTISRALVQQMGGELTLSSAPGQGSTFAFTLTLPKTEAPPPAAAAAARPAPDDGALAGRRVLLVEDNAINRLVARQLLRGWGVAVDEAEDGPAALACLREALPYDAVLLDIQLPGLNGVDVARQVRDLPETRRARVPLLALTANAYAADARQYRAAGFDDVLAKPYDEAALRAKLLALCYPPVRLYDLSTFQALARGHAEFVPAVIRSFLADVPPALLRLQQAVAAADWPEAGRLVHFVKPNLEALQVAGTAAPVAALEQVRRRPPATPAEADALRQAADALLAAVAAVQPLLERELAGG